VNEKEKYELMWAKCGRYGKDWTNNGLARSFKGWFKSEVTSPARVIDFGCGNASSLAWLESLGHDAAGVDIADNAPKHPNVVIADLREDFDLPAADYGICADVMEHIPTDDVDSVMANIAGHVTKGVLFGIARTPDKDGGEFGLTLHLTLRDRAWWDKAALKYFDRVVPTRYNDKAYCFWGFK
jgi:SAM-dependent methyltransferase